MSEIKSIITSKFLTYEQKIIALARAAENMIDVLEITPEVQSLREEGVICDLYEGNAPYRPRYIVPNYQKLMEEGSEFLELSPPKTLQEAITTLLIMYHHVPSITSYPVYVGNLDYLLEPFIQDEEEAYQAIKNMLLQMDRTISDSFCHGNLGPKETTAGRLILKAERALQNAVPNLTLKVGKETPEVFLLDAIDTAMTTAKPSFANNEMFTKDFDDQPYGIASCYNGLPIGGGATTLVRLNLKGVAKSSSSREDFLDRALPYAAKHMMAYMDERTRFLIEESNFFESNFLATEGFIEKEKFTGMFGLFGLAECVNTLLKREGQQARFGHDQEADALGLEIIKALDQLVGQHENSLITFNKGRYMLHAQVGIDTDYGTSPGTRIPIGDEPIMMDHLRQAALYHPYFPSGTGDVFRFDETYHKNLPALAQIVHGGFQEGMRYLSLYGENADVVRITGYLVKKSEIEKLKAGKAVRHDTVELGRGAAEKQGVLERKMRK